MEEIDVVFWLLGLITLLVICVTFLIWILMWAADNGMDTISSWGTQFALAVIQDIFLYQPIKLYLMHVLAIEVLRPRLRNIYNILNIVAARSEDNSCRSRINNEGTFSVAVVQHLSATCRAARNRICSVLPSSQLLATITDYDVFLCRDAPHSSLTLISWALIMIPTVLALTNEWIQDGCMTVAITALWTLFVVANDQLLQVSIWALIIPYIVLCLVIFIDLFMLSPRRKRTATPAKHTGFEKNGSKCVGRQKSGFISKPNYRLTGSMPNALKSGLIATATPMTTISENLTKTQQQILWRNINLPTNVQGSIRKYRFQNQIVMRSKVRRPLNVQASTLTEDRDELAVISAEVLDMRIDSLQNYMKKRENSSIRKKIESIIWKPDMLSNQGDVSMHLDSNLLLQSHFCDSNHSIHQKWMKQRKTLICDDNYISAYNVFIEFDKNKSGFLESNELHCLAEWILQKFNPDLDCSIEECDDTSDGLLSMLDKEGTQCVSFERFLPWYNQLELSVRDFELKDSMQKAGGRTSRGLRGIKVLQDEVIYPMPSNHNKEHNPADSSIILTERIFLFV